jgi:RNA polymerase sigma factor (sigma-70 family)
MLQRYHHITPYIDAVESERQADAARRRAIRAAESERLVRAAAARDEDAWSSLIERFTKRVRGVARAHRLASHDADDVMQTTWLRLYEQIGRLRDPAGVGAWLQTTATRESLRLIREVARERPADVEALSERLEAPELDRRLADVDRRSALADALAGLSERDRALLRMLFADDEPSYDEISRTLGMPIGSIGPTRARCLARLRTDPALAHAVRDEA